MISLRLRITHKLVALVVLVFTGFGLLLWGLGAEIQTARGTWDEFAQANKAIFQAMMAGGRDIATPVLSMQALRNQRFTDQIDQIVNMLTLKGEELEVQAREEVQDTMRRALIHGFVL